MGSVADTYTNWRTSGINWDAPPHESCSPNLVALNRVLKTEFGLPDLGCHHDRPVRAGSSLSVHSWGAAKDNGTTTGATPRSSLDRAISFLLWVAPRTGLQQIHDYSGDRIWKNNRNSTTYPDGWKKQNGQGTGMGEAWASYLHVEVNHPNFLVSFDYSALVAEWKNGVASPPVDLIDMSRHNSITKYADIPDVPLVHQTQILHGVTAITIDPRWVSRMPWISENREIVGGYVPLVGSAHWPVSEQMAFHINEVGRYWRPGFFSQIDCERWAGRYPVVTIDELALALEMHEAQFGPDRVIVYMNPNELPELWFQFVHRFPHVARWVPDYSEDGSEQAVRHGATVHQWSDSVRPSGFSTNVPVNQVLDRFRLRQVAGLESPVVVPDPSVPPVQEDVPMFRYRHTAYADQFAVGAGAIKLTPDAAKLPQYAALPLVENADHVFLGQVLLAAQFNHALLTPMN